MSASGARDLRLVEDGVLEPNEEGGQRVFTDDHAFNAPSGAAAIVQGAHVNGWNAWVDGDGRTLDRLERR
jgi:hypothetical protein